MADPALSRMTLAEFLAWDSGNDCHYQLIEGHPVAMAPPAAAHGKLVTRLARHIDAALDSRPTCSVIAEAGVTLPRDDRTFYVADLAVTCRPLEPRQQAVPEPLLIIEVLSPSTDARDSRTKLEDYRSIASVEEIALVDSQSVHAEIHRRAGDGRWYTDLISGRAKTLHLASIGLDLPLATLYEGIEVEEVRRASRE